MAIIETPDDASIRIDRIDGKLCIAPEWEPQKGQFGYGPEAALRVLRPRRPRGHVQAISCVCQEVGLLKTLDREATGEPERGFAGRGGERVVLGEGRPGRWCADMQAKPASTGSSGATGRVPKSSQAMNQTSGVLTSRYDIYQDLMDPQRRQRAASRRAPGLDAERLAEGHHARRDRQLDPGLGRRRQGRQAVPLRRAVRQAGVELRRPSACPTS